MTVFLCEIDRKQKPTGRVREEFGSGRDSSLRYKTEKLIGKKSGETEDQACNQTS